MKKQNNIATQILVILILIGVALVINTIFYPSRAKISGVDSGYRVIMGTFAHIVVVADDSQICQNSISSAFTKLDQIEKMMSYHDSGSELSRLNSSAFEKSVKPSPELYELILKSIEFSRQTDGAFDITVGPLVDLFRLEQKTHTKPTPEQIAWAKQKTGYGKLVVDPNAKTIRFAIEGMKLDLGGIAKGYAIDSAIQVIKDSGALGAMVDIGGDIRCFGKPPGNTTCWIVGLQNPANTDPNEIPYKQGQSCLLTLSINNKAVTTSGDYRRFALVQGEKVSHIINPQIGFGAKELSSVTVIADSALIADAMATAATVLGVDKSLTLIESIPQIEAILIKKTEPLEIIKTSGADAYIR